MFFLLVFWFLGLVWDFCFALFVLFFFFIKIWFNYFSSTMPEIQTLSWLRKLKFHMVLLSPGKASFNLANWIVSYFLFCQIFSHRDIESALNGKKTGLRNLHLEWSEKKKKTNSSILNAVKRWFGFYRSRSLFKLKLVRNSAFSQSG